MGGIYEDTNLLFYFVVVERYPDVEVLAVIIGKGVDKNNYGWHNYVWDH